MEYKGVHVESYGYRSPYPVPDFREFLDLAARVDALEKRLAKVCELATLTAANIGDKAVKEAYLKSQGEKEKLAAAFIAETGLSPSECEIVTYPNISDRGWSTFFRKRSVIAESEPTPKPASEYITKERAVEIANDWFPDDFGAARVGFHVAIATEPGANVVNEIEAATRVSFVDYNRGVADGRRKGVEAVAKWLDATRGIFFPIADCIRANIESILKEAGDDKG